MKVMERAGKTIFASAPFFLFFCKKKIEGKGWIENGKERR
jgi:hypothetical protein